ncbi:MAG TPA: 2-phospho-L-lactate guanylyltransferase [Actinotalea sp.]
MVPVKRLADAKTRLDVGSDGQGPARGDLALAFALDTIHAVLAAGRVARLVVVTSEPSVEAALAGREQVTVVADPGAGLNPALVAGLASLASTHAGPVAVLLGDLPALRPAELDAALGLAGGTPLALVPDAAGTGTTLLTGRRAEALVPRFGPGSCAAHAAGGHVVLDVTDLPTVRQDVDSAEDLEAAVRWGVGAATAHVLARLASQAGAPSVRSGSPPAPGSP